MESSCTVPFSWAKFLSGSLMVVGTTVGAGMLGIPLLTAKAGLGAALWITFGVWLFMLATGLLLLEVSYKMPKGANLLSLSSRYLGKRGQWLTCGLFLFLYYSLLVAYFSGGAPLLGQGISFLFGIELSQNICILIFTTIFGVLAALGARSLDKANLLLSLFMLACYVFLVVLGSRGIDLGRFENNEWSCSFAAVPVLFSAFGYHNIVPSLVSYIGKEKKVLRLSILFGTCLAFLIYAVWQWLILGALPLDALEDTLRKGLPVTYALQASSGSRMLYVFGQLFAFSALTTSLIGVSFSLVDFLKDGFDSFNIKVKRYFCVLLAFTPPCLFVFVDPAIFDRALGVAGGFGEAILNGLLPIVLFDRMLSKESSIPQRSLIRYGLFILAVWCTAVIFFEVKQILNI